jgi:methionyl-tRNA synthetase
MKSPVYVTTAIPYVNAKPHIGFAMEIIEADAIARYFRLTGHDTYFLTGADEHGIKQQRTAEKLGISPQELCDQNAQKFMELTKILNISNDDFIRTTDQKRHWPAVQKLWKKLSEAGDIYKSEYEGLYCSGCERFMTEKELVDGLCPHHDRPEKVVEENYFFRLSKYSKTVQKLVETKKVEVVPEFRAAEIMNVIKDGLQDVSFSRSRKTLSWGIPVPGDEEQVIYVWCDALPNYISAIGYANETEQFKKYWPRVIHVIGKDIVRFHVALWPAMLLSAQVPPPEKVLIHGFITSEGKKMSKSLGNVVDPVEITRQYGVDALRYYLLSEIPVGQDGDFSQCLFEERYTAHLANNLGNLLNRVLLMTKKYFAGKIPPPTDPVPLVLAAWQAYQKEMEALMLHKGIAVVFELINHLNKMIEEEKPWELAKNNQIDKLLNLMYRLLESLRQVSLMLWPFLPDTAEKMWRQLGIPNRQEFEKDSAWGGRGDWGEVGEVSILFPKLNHD